MTVQKKYTFPAIVGLVTNNLSENYQLHQLLVKNTNKDLKPSKLLFSLFS